MSDTTIETVPDSGSEVDGAAETDTQTGIDTGRDAEAEAQTAAAAEACPRCSAERLDGVPFCTNCSLRFLPAEFWVVRQAAAPAVESIPARRRRRWPWVLLLLLLIAGAAAAYYVLYGVPPELAEYRL